MTLATRRATVTAATLMIVFLLLLSSPASVGLTWAGTQTWPQMGGRLFRGDVTWNNSTYWIGTQSSGGWFSSHQSADVMLDGQGFNNATGPLNFNDPTAIATDGTHLLLADSSNNRILVWNTPPSSDVAPDLVLGQSNFTSNLSGNTTGQMDWPVSVSTDGTHVVVADTDNNRILIWNEFPTRSGQPADLVIDCCQWFGLVNGGPASQNWPNAVWTNGTTLVVAATLGGYVFIWSHFPTRNNQPPNMYLTAQGRFGTPRSIISNGQYLMVADENAVLQSGGVSGGTWVWTHFPDANDTPPSFLMTQADPKAVGEPQLWGTFTSGGGLVTIAKNGRLDLWSSPPMNATDYASSFVGTGGDLFYSGLYRWQTGSPPGGVAFAAGRLYVAERGGEKIAVFNSIPSAATAVPDFAIGAASPAIDNGIVYSYADNPIPSSDGQSLVVTSSNALMYVWKNLPDQSGARPDIFYDNPTCISNATLFCYSQSQYFQADGQALYGHYFVAVGETTVWVWDQLPVAGQGPTAVYTGHIGDATFSDLTGVAIDSGHFYLADAGANKVWVWNGVPGPDTNPAYALDVTSPSQISSDGSYLAVAQGSADQVSVFNVATLASGAQPSVVTLTNDSALNGEMFPGVAHFNGVADALVAGGHLFAADTGNNRVLAWQSVQDAVDGKAPDVVLGQTNFESSLFGSGVYGNGPAGLFMPAYLAWDGSHLWVGEYKFAHELVRFSLPALQGSQTYKLSVDGRTMSLGSVTSDTVSDVSYNPWARAVRFTVDASSGGSTTLLFPTVLLNGSLEATVDGSPVASTTAAYNSTYTSVDVSYPGGAHTVEISGTAALMPKAASSLSLYVTGSEIAPQNADMSPFQMATDGPLNITAVLAPSSSDGSLALEYRVGVLTSYCGFCEPFSGWTNITSSTPVRGVVAATWTPPANGTYEIRALWGGDPTHEASASTTFDVQVQSNPSTTSTSTTSTATLTTSATFTSTTSNTFTATTTSTSPNPPPSPPPTGQLDVTVSPPSGPNGTVVTLSGTGLAPAQEYRYCYQSGPPPQPPTPPSACPAGSPTFTSGQDGSIPSSPAVALKVAGPPGTYTIVISSTTSPMVVPFGFTITGASAATTSAISSQGTGSVSISTSSAASSQSQAAPSSQGGGGVPEFPYQPLAAMALALVVVLSYLMLRRQTRRSSSPAEHSSLAPR